MYTIIKASEKLGVSKVTLYRHMAKNGINKGSKLTEEHMSILENSIGKSKKVNVNDNKILLKEKEYTYKINQLEADVKSLEDKVLQLEHENRRLLSELGTSQVLVNKTQTQNAELLDNNQKLLEHKKSWWEKISGK